MTYVVLAWCVKVRRVSRRYSTAFGAVLGAATAALIAAAALQARDGASAAVSFTCVTETDQQATIKTQQAEMLCSAARRALENLPVPPNPPALNLVVISANDRSAGLSGTWLFPGGQERIIAPVRTSFFDTFASPALHDRFVQIFFQTNPIPTWP